MALSEKSLVHDSRLAKQGGGGYAGAATGTSRPSCSQCPQPESDKETDTGVSTRASSASEDFGSGGADQESPRPEAKKLRGKNVESPGKRDRLEVQEGRLSEKERSDDNERENACDSARDTLVEEEDEDGEDDDDVKEDSDNDFDESAFTKFMRATPCYPFPADFSLEFDGRQIMGIRHLCKDHPPGTKVIVMCLPGVHGGVGPCRTPGQNFCENALYPSLARRITETEAPVSFYRCSWPFMRPEMHYAVSGVVRILQHAVREAISEHPPSEESPREFGVFFIGHSLGGAVAMHCAEVITRHFGQDGVRAAERLGEPGLVLRLKGVCTLNGAMDMEQFEGRNAFQSLASADALIVSGDADAVVPPECSDKLFESLAVRSKRQLVVPGATHDLFTAKDQLLDELSDFILKDL